MPYIRSLRSKFLHTVAALAGLSLLLSMGCIQGPPKLPEGFLDAPTDAAADHKLPTTESTAESADSVDDELYRLGVRLFTKEENRELLLQQLAKAGIESAREGHQNVVVYVFPDELQLVLEMEGVENFQVVQDQPYLNELYLKIKGTPTAP